ncbi:MAG TPA: YdiU family protein, partial [Polyangiaceae bacterium LLY-WYZ-14_1]|nr:YdiU family protein [Polyangiaceae bacterium LLY-WYZ-14_1]
MLDLEQTFRDDLDDAFWIEWDGAQVPEPRLVLLNRGLADELGLDADALDSQEGARTFAGARAPEGVQPVALAYAGHQFGGFSPRLGDGRALLLGEVVDQAGRRHDLHLKGSGATPFSRGGDGKAVLGPVLREYIVGEAMHGLGIPTTRALAAVTTGEDIVRQGGVKPGAVLARIASSHLRIGTFEYFAARRDTERVRRLVEHALRRHDPDRLEADDPALKLLRAVRDRQAKLVAQWLGVGFIHGVMNTDNTAISGQTIDYGPCAFMDGFDPNTVFSSIDQHGRYAYANQPGILQWNLTRLAEALVPVVNAGGTDEAVALVTPEIEAFEPRFHAEWGAVLRAKLGLREEREGDDRLADDLLEHMAAARADFTSTFRALAQALRDDRSDLNRLFDGDEAIDAWTERWLARLDAEGADPARRADAMDEVNPVYIARNHLVEAALEAAEEELDLAPARELLEVLADPF